MPRKRFRLRMEHLQSLSRGPGNRSIRFPTSLSLFRSRLVCVFRGLFLVLASISWLKALMKQMSCRQCRRHPLTNPTIVLIASLMFVVLTKWPPQLQIPQPTKNARPLPPVKLGLMPTLQGLVTLCMWKH